MNALAGLSLILALATAGLWGRSYWVFDRWVMPGKHARIESWQSQMTVVYAVSRMRSERDWRWHGFGFSRTWTGGWSSRHEPKPERVLTGIGLPAHRVAFPHWS